VTAVEQSNFRIQVVKKEKRPDISTQALRQVVGYTGLELCVTLSAGSETVGSIEVSFESEDNVLHLRA